MTPDQQVTRAIEAKQVLDNPAYAEAMNTLKLEIVNQWKACPIRDQEGQALLLQLAKLAEKFDGILHGLVETGKLAQHRIDLDAVRNESKARQWLRKVG